jgi:hypothetical protein
MSNYSSYLESSINILKKYSLSSIVEGIPIENINQMIIDHQLELSECDTFDKALVVANRALIDVTGFHIKIESFISNRDDLMSLYDIFIDWRNSVIRQPL